MWLKVLGWLIVLLLPGGSILALIIIWSLICRKLNDKEKIMCFGCGNSNHKETKAKELVFCSDCEHCKFKIKPDRAVNDRCFHPEVCSKREWVKPNPIRKGYWNEWIESGNCWRLNSNNNCELFKQEEYPDRSEG